MTVKRPQPGELDPIETASRDEISALQLQRLQWSVRHTYDNVEPYRKRCEEQGVHPDDLKTLADLGKFPFMTKTDLSVRPLRRAAQQGGPPACVQRHHRQVGGGGLHQE